MNSKIKKHRVSGGFDPRNYKFLESFDNRIVKCDPEDEGEPLEPIPQDLFDRLIADRGIGSGDRLSVMVNSLGATPPEELYILYRVVQKRI